MTLMLSDDARRYIAEQGFDPVYGARPLRRFIAQEVETRIGRALLGGEIARRRRDPRRAAATASWRSSSRNPASEEHAA